MLNDSAAPSSDPQRPIEKPHRGGSTGSLPRVRERLGQLTQQIHRLQRSVRLAIESELADWAGQSYGSLAANQDVVKMIHETVDGQGLRLRCPECGHPAILRCSARPGVPEGVFVFDHTIEGRRTFHGGGSTLPALRVVSKPARRRSAG